MIKSTIVTIANDAKAYVNDQDIAVMTAEVQMTYDASGNRVLKKFIPHAADECTPPSTTEPELIIIDLTSNEALRIEADGDFFTCKPATRNPDALKAGALTISDKDGAVIFGFSKEGIKTVSAITWKKPPIVEIGSFFVTYQPITGPGNVTASLTEDGGAVYIAGALSGPTIQTGTAYADGKAVYNYDFVNSDWDLSYVNISGDGVSLPSGGFRYHIKDHLGSTRLTLNSGSTAASPHEATGYLAYGLNKALLTPPPGEDIKEKFTGKEFDEDGGMFLEYFGARYYDPEIACWIIPDALKQFASSYLYTGNGFNPIIGVDPNGLKIRLYGSNAFGIPGANHVFFWSTDLERGIGRYGASGTETSPPGTPAAAEVAKLKEFYDVNLPKGMSDEDFLTIAKLQADADINQPWIPGKNDCHTTAEKICKASGAEYPGWPEGRVNYDDQIKSGWESFKSSVTDIFQSIKDYFAGDINY